MTFGDFFLVTLSATENGFLRMCAEYHHCKGEASQLWLVSSLTDLDLVALLHANYGIISCLVESNSVKLETRIQCHKQI